MFEGASSFNQDLSGWPSEAKNADGFCGNGAKCNIAPSFVSIQILNAK